MEDDDLYPNDSTYWFPREPKDQSIGRKVEKAKTLEGLAELKVVIAHLDEKIDFFERHSNIPDSVRTDPKAFLIMSNSYTMTAENLRAEKEYIESLLSEHAPNN